MNKLFIAYATALCVLLAYANYHGMSVSDLTAKKWTPKGKQQYHK